MIFWIWNKYKKSYLQKELCYLHHYQLNIYTFKQFNLVSSSYCQKPLTQDYLQKLNYFITIKKTFPLAYKFKLYMKKNKCMVFHTYNKILTAVNQMQNKWEISPKWTIKTQGIRFCYTFSVKCFNICTSWTKYTQ